MKSLRKAHGCANSHTRIELVAIGRLLHWTTSHVSFAPHYSILMHEWPCLPLFVRPCLKRPGTGPKRCPAALAESRRSGLITDTFGLQTTLPAFLFASGVAHA